MTTAGVPGACDDVLAASGEAQSPFVGGRDFAFFAYQ
jgi:hypothetical protein